MASESSASSSTSSPAAAATSSSIINPADVLIPVHEDDLCCPISFERFINPVITPCGHTFEQDEILRTLSIKRQCPICREVVDTKSLIPNLIIKSLVSGQRVNPDRYCVVCRNTLRLGGKEGIYKCIQCKKVAYCSRSCLDSDRIRHTFECGRDLPINLTTTYCDRKTCRSRDPITLTDKWYLDVDQIISGEVDGCLVHNTLVEIKKTSIVEAIVIDNANCAVSSGLMYIIIKTIECHHSIKAFAFRGCVFNKDILCFLFHILTYFSPRLNSVLFLSCSFEGCDPLGCIRSFLQNRNSQFYLLLNDHGLPHQIVNRLKKIKTHINVSIKFDVPLKWSDGIPTYSS